MPVIFSMWAGWWRRVREHMRIPAEPSNRRDGTTASNHWRVETPGLDAEFGGPYELSAERDSRPATDVLAQLSRSRLFQRLSPVGVSRLATLCCVEHFSAREILVHRDAPGDWLHVITAGRVELEAPGGADETQYRFIELGEGDVVGSDRLLDSGPHVSIARAITDVNTLRVSRVAVALLMLQSPAGRN
jgi:hypothetical protein